MSSSDPWKEVAPSKDFPCKIPSADVLQHIHEVRDKAWDIRPYPCTGLGTFLQPTISKSPAYSTIISRLQSGDSFLDVGCYLSQDLKKLVFDGVSSDRLHGVDIVNHWDLGYEFFQDKKKFEARFIDTDILNPNEELRALVGKIDIISVTHVLHQWDWKTQIVAAKQLNALSKSGTLVVGLQIGTSEGAKKIKEDDTQWEMQQDLESWAEMWKIVGEETGTKWKSDAQLKTFAELGFVTEDTDYLTGKVRVLQFVITRNR
ncbi:uncharacterized protein LY89DRAFT_757061 [Mollisia scopiformis]|uniref:Methyltransferase domain-containing protein n=1 Tax=Mollisia scopiformis TaxID=149040 RepID=A0A194WXX5_MOLSC|nr:uncharacterized protein LY89DRAFT_757061 [Mollisia scopiformis]KUJ12544.1 hypothetical protein LY89DRAFT_757061 [Mollisia scopiformis]